MRMKEMENPESDDGEEKQTREPQSVQPICDESIKPFVGKTFQTLEEGIEFYKNYAGASGFDIRLGTKKKSSDKQCILWRYIYCNKEGDKNAAPDEGEGEKKKRRRISKRTGCMARMVMRYSAASGYVVKNFVEDHNHALVSQHSKPFMKLNRNIDFVHKKFVMDCAKAAIGPVKAFRLFKEFVGRYEYVGCSSNEFKTVSREMKAFVDGRDAQMVLDKLRKKKELCPAYTFEYEVDADDKLTRLFWCDPISRRNYNLFGDIVSFDATYSTNRYCMIFTPFTGKDNHGKPVTFAAGLISKEDADSYCWLFDKFKNCMRKPPSLIVTDQDLGMRVGVERVLEGTRHRYCMWHIMLKVAEKVPHHLKKDEEFKKKLCAVVWSESIEPPAFEQGWEELMKEYALSGEKWFGDMYEIRRLWIPAYFRDFPMSGIIKTTSISESENSRFGRFTRARDNLVEFFMHYESAIEAQRHANGELNYQDETCNNKVETRLALEKHAAKVYTRSRFIKVQEQIASACYQCRILNINTEEGIFEYKMGDWTREVSTVIYKTEENSAEYSCKMFIRLGILCSHIFLLFKNMNYKNIPEKYIVRRWLKKPGMSQEDDVAERDIEKYVAIDETKRKASRVISEFYNCYGLVEGNPEKMDELYHDIMNLKEKYKTTGDEGDAGQDKQTKMERYYGAAMPQELEIMPPKIVKTKESGSRLKSRKEKALRQLNKPLRKCSKCQQLTNHDARNCGK